MAAVTSVPAPAGRSRWTRPARERARAYGFWMMNIAIASITAPLSGWSLTWGDWRDLFFVEGAFPFLIAAPLWWWLVADRPSQASWVSQGERAYIETSLEREQADAPAFAGYRSVLRSSVVTLRRQADKPVPVPPTAPRRAPSAAARS